jgi:hypothetical protein
MEKRGNYKENKKDKPAIKLIKKARESDIRRKKIEEKGEKLMKSKYEYDAKDKRKMKMLAKKKDEDFKREARRDERSMRK